MLPLSAADGVVVLHHSHGFPQRSGARAVPSHQRLQLSGHLQVVGQHAHVALECRARGVEAGPVRVRVNAVGEEVVRLQAPGQVLRVARVRVERGRGVDGADGEGGGCVAAVVDGGDEDVQAVEPFPGDLVLEVAAQVPHDVHAGRVALGHGRLLQRVADEAVHLGVEVVVLQPVVRLHRVVLSALAEPVEAEPGRRAVVAQVGEGAGPDLTGLAQRGRWAPHHLQLPAVPAYLMVLIVVLAEERRVQPHTSSQQRRMRGRVTERV